MKKLLVIIVLVFFSSAEAYSKEKMIVCYNNDIELRFYIDEENSRVKSGGDLIKNFYKTIKFKKFYLPRIDKLVINQFEEVKLIKGESAEEPTAPVEFGDSMEIAEITLPPYLYDPQKQGSIKM